MYLVGGHSDVDGTMILRWKKYAGLVRVLSVSQWDTESYAPLFLAVSNKINEDELFPSLQTLKIYPHLSQGRENEGSLKLLTPTITSISLPITEAFMERLHLKCPKIQVLTLKDSWKDSLVERRLHGLLGHLRFLREVTLHLNLVDMPTLSALSRLPRLEQIVLSSLTNSNLPRITSNSLLSSSSSHTYFATSFTTLKGLNLQLSQPELLPTLFIDVFDAAPLSSLDIDIREHLVDPIGVHFPVLFDTRWIPLLTSLHILVGDSKLPAGVSVSPRMTKTSIEPLSCCVALAALKIDVVRCL